VLCCGFWANKDEYNEPEIRFLEHCTSQTSRNVFHRLGQLIHINVVYMIVVCSYACKYIRIHCINGLLDKIIGPGLSAASWQKHGCGNCEIAVVCQLRNLSSCFLHQITTHDWVEFPLAEDRRSALRPAQLTSDHWPALKSVLGAAVIACFRRVTITVAWQSWVLNTAERPSEPASEQLSSMHSTQCIDDWSSSWRPQPFSRSDTAAQRYGTPTWTALALSKCNYNDNNWSI